MESGRKSSSSSGRKKAASRSPVAGRGPHRDAAQFAVCIRNDGYPASLELRKLYEVIDDAFGGDHGLIRVIDESGEDYLYPSDYFVRVDLPVSLEEALHE